MVEYLQESSQDFQTAPMKMHNQRGKKQVMSLHKNITLGIQCLQEKSFQRKAYHSNKILKT